MALLEDEIVGLYASFFKRKPDEEGFDDGASKINAEIHTLDDIVTCFAGSHYLNRFKRNI